MTVFLANEQVEQPVDETGLIELARMVMESLGVAEAELSVLCVEQPVMADLNQRYLGEQRATDVLAFPMDGPEPASGPPPGPTGPPPQGGLRYVAMDADSDDEGDTALDDEPWMLGDVVLCPSYAASQASKAGHSVAAELELLTVHGILHLCGFDHAEPEEEQAMTQRTDELLALWRSRPPVADGGTESLAR